MQIRHGDASVHVTRKDGLLFVHDLQSYGNAGDLMRVVRDIQAFAVLEPVYIHVVVGNPKQERLIEFYKRVGARPEAVVMKMGGK